MAKSLRLSEEEQELLRKRGIEINKVLVSKGIEPVKDSELAHEILKQGLKSVCVINGKIEILNT